MAKKSKQAAASMESNGVKAVMSYAKTGDVKGKGKAVAGSEIDDIFAENSKVKEVERTAPATDEVASTEVTPSASKKKQKKRKLEDGTEAETKQASISLADLEMERKKRKQKPVEVVDTSNAVLARTSTSKKSKRVNGGGKTVNKDTAAKQAEEDELFRDSRGTSNRRQTEDGLAIYDINELNIGKGGDTALCPFDCECCF